MKYCPYCGAALVDSLASFCAECGERMPPAGKQSDDTPSKTQKPAHRSEAPEPVPADDYDDYDGYYDDVLPGDEGNVRKPLHPGLIKRIVLLAGGAVIVIVLAILAMYFL